MVVQNDYFHNHNQSKSSSCPSIRIDLVSLIEIIHFSSDLQGLFCYIKLYLLHNLLVLPVFDLLRLKTLTANAKTAQ